MGGFDSHGSEANGSGGGSGRAGCPGKGNAGGGAGGGNASAGGNGGNAYDCSYGSASGSIAPGGIAIDSAGSGKLFPGGGGGSGGLHDTTGFTGPAGNGGGIIYLAANSITIDGDKGQRYRCHSFLVHLQLQGWLRGGAGGSIYLETRTRFRWQILKPEVAVDLMVTSIRQEARYPNNSRKG